jgi:hypothetical protein
MDLPDQDRPHERETIVMRGVRGPAPDGSPFRAALRAVLPPAGRGLKPSMARARPDWLRAWTTAGKTQPKPGKHRPKPAADPPSNPDRFRLNKRLVRSRRKHVPAPGGGPAATSRSREPVPDGRQGGNGSRSGAQQPFIAAD